MNSRLRNLLVGVVLGLGILAATVVALSYWLYRAAEREFVHPHLTPGTRAADIRRLEVTDSSGALAWSIVNTNATTAEPIDYGSVPSGFAQLFPRGHGPRELVRGEHLLLSYTTRTGWARINIWQRSGNRFRFGIATSGQPPLPDNEMFVLNPRIE